MPIVAIKSDTSVIASCSSNLVSIVPCLRTPAWYSRWVEWMRAAALTAAGLADLVGWNFGCLPRPRRGPLPVRCWQREQFPYVWLGRRWLQEADGGFISCKDKKKVDFSLLIDSRAGECITGLVGRYKSCRKGLVGGKWFRMWWPLMRGTLCRDRAQSLFSIFLSTCQTTVTSENHPDSTVFHGQNEGLLLVQSLSNFARLLSRHGASVSKKIFSKRTNALIFGWLVCSVGCAPSLKNCVLNEGTESLFQISIKSIYGQI